MGWGEGQREEARDEVGELVALRRLIPLNRACLPR